MSFGDEVANRLNEANNVNRKTGAFGKGRKAGDKARKHLSENN